MNDRRILAINISDSGISFSRNGTPTRNESKSIHINKKGKSTKKKRRRRTKGRWDYDEGKVLLSQLNEEQPTARE